MMRDSKDYLYELLPMIYRRRDVEQGSPLRALLQVIAEQVEVVRKDIDQLYDNWFIETCQNWVVPYIGDLVGYQPVHDAGEPGDIGTEQEAKRNKILIPRAEVAHTIRNRRRKGTLALLELLANDVAGWPARAVEFYTLLSYTQALNHLRLDRGRTANLRQVDAISRINGPFDEIAHTIEIRRPNSNRTRGRYNIPSVGLFVWRIRTFSITRSPIYYLERQPPHCFTFNVLGNNMSLFTRSVPDPELTRIAGELNLPVPIRREALQGEKIKLPNGDEVHIASADYYGSDRSLAIWADDWAGNDPNQPIPREAVIPANLSEWDYDPPENFVAVDPELGRIAFPPDPKQLPAKGAWVYYNYGFVTEIGGGEYNRPIIDPSSHALSLSLFRWYDFKNAKNLIIKLKDEVDPLSQYIRSQFSSATESLLVQHDMTTEPNYELKAALADELTALIQVGALDETLVSSDKYSEEIIQLLRRLHAGELSDQEIIRLNRLLLEVAYSDEIIKSYKLYRVGPDPKLYKSVKAALDVWHNEKPREAVVEIVDSGVYTITKEALKINFNPFQSLQIRAAAYKRPVIRLLDIQFSGRDAIEITGAPGSRFTLDGLLVFGRGVYVENEIDEVNIRHSTLVPGWGLEPGCEPKNAKAASLTLVDTNTRLHISHSILGSIEIHQHEVRSDPIQITMSDSILDATDDQEDALSAGECERAHAILTILRCTVIGHIHAHQIQLAENSIFTGVVMVAHRQRGCMRFCYVTPLQEAAGSSPQLQSRTPRRYNCQPDLVEKTILTKYERKEITEEQKDQGLRSEPLRVIPQFNSKRYCQPDYCQLADSCAAEIKRGADDESEMGVYHDLFLPQREANLRTRLDEYTPAGMDAGIFFVN